MVTQISTRQSAESLEQDILMTVEEFNVQQHLIRGAEEAMDIAIESYAQTKQRFMIGKADINSLTLSLKRQQDAQRNYVSALKMYWMSYYKIRKLTLFNFDLGLPLSSEFDYRQKIR